MSLQKSSTNVDVTREYTSEIALRPISGDGPQILVPKLQLGNAIVFEPLVRDDEEAGASRDIRNAKLGLRPRGPQE